MSEATDRGTPESAAAIFLCEQAAAQLKQNISCDVYLCGSVIYDDGEQFDPQLSDLDIVVVLEGNLTATERAAALEGLFAWKQSLELQLIPVLHRVNCVDPAISVVLVSSLEVQVNAHKSGSRSFFDKNVFLNLTTGEQQLSLPSAAIGSLPDEHRQALEYVQRTRNEFLSVSANATGGLAWYDGPDPLPKAVARLAAQLIPNPAVGQWYDTRLGLEYLWSRIDDRRDETPEIKQLFKTLSVRRAGRGRKRPLSPFQQVLLSEILYDVAAETPTVPLVTWEIRFRGEIPTDAERSRLLDGLRRLVPDGRVVQVRTGSLIVRLISPKRSYETLALLDGAGALALVFGVEAVDLGPISNGDDSSVFKSDDAIDRIASRIASWRPSADLDAREYEQSLEDWLRTQFLDSTDILGANLSRNYTRGFGSDFRSADFLLRYQSDGQQRENVVAIEVARVPSRTAFFRHVEQAINFTVPTLLVLIVNAALAANLTEEIRKTANLAPHLRVLTITPRREGRPPPGTALQTQ